VAQLEGKRVVITGGASGIGAASAAMMTERGARVAILDFDQAAMDAVVAAVPGSIGVFCDATDSTAVDAAVAEVVDAFGGIDVLFCCVGPLGDEVKKNSMTQHGKQAAKEGRLVFSDSVTSAVLDLTDEAWHAEFASVVDNVFYCTRAVLPHLLAQGSGSIITSSSIHGIQGQPGVPHYSAAKAAINGFVRSVAKEVAPRGVRINSIAAGYVDTPRLRTLTTPELQDGFRRMVPMGRIAHADEIAGVACFLASDDASYVSGQVISPNGAYVTV